MTKQETITLLSKTFSYILKEWLNKSQIKEVIRRNKTPEYANCCASHDYCDANMAMFEGFQRCIGRDPVLNDDKDLSLINRAWDIAKSKQFYTQ